MGVVYTENFKITPGKGNCFEFIHNSKTLKESKSSCVWKSCAPYIFDIFIINLFALLILMAVTLILVQPLEIYGMLLANLTIFIYFIYYDNSSKQRISEKKWINLMSASFESRKSSLEKIFCRYCTKGVPGLLLIAIDVTANGVAIASEHLGFYFIIPLVTYMPVLFMSFKQSVNDLFTDKFFLKSPNVSPAVNLAGNEE